jgi:hypothetical protein
MAVAKYRDPSTGAYVPVLGVQGNAFTGAQVSSAAPTPRGAGDIWIDTSTTLFSWDTAWKTPTLLTGWSQYGPSWPVRYRKLSNGMVVMEGLITKSTTSAVNEVFLYLPVGYRPLNKNHLPMCHHTGAGAMGVDTTGGVSFVLSYPTGGWQSINGSFYAEA